MKIAIIGKDEKLVDVLLNEGHEVSVYNNYRNNKEKCNTSYGDITNFSDLRSFFLNVKPEVVYHLYILDFENEPRYEAFHNIVGTINILELCKQEKVSELVYRKIDKKNISQKSCEEYIKSYKIRNRII